MKSSKILTIKTRSKEYIVGEGKPVILVWRSKNKTRPGLSTAVGWLKRGENPHTVTLIHSCFQTWDKMEQEYPSKWTVWMSQIIDIRPLTAMRSNYGN